MSHPDRPIALAPARARSRLPMGIAGAALIIAAAGGALLMVGSRGPAPASRLRTALQKLDRPDDPAAWETARRLASEVRSAGYRDTRFPGGTEFVLGVVTARTAASDAESAREYASAVKLLREAEQHGLTEDRRPEWAFALGMSLFALHQSEAAERVLEEAWSSYPDGRIEAGLALVELEIANPEPDSTGRTGEILAELAASSKLTPDQRRRLVSLRARTALEAGRLDDAEAALSKLDKDARTDAETALLWAELRIAQDRLEEARKWLLPVAFLASAEDEPARTAAAAYRLGRCDERRGDEASAARAYERAAGIAPESAAGTAAALAAARLLQRAGRDEEALTLFRRAIGSQAAGDPPPLRAEDFGRDVRSACERWIERGAFDLADALAAAAEPVLGRTESLDLRAQSREEAAGRAEQLWQAADEPGRAAMEAERIELWRKSGTAHREVAKAVSDSARIGAALWTAGDHFRRGHAFTDADAVLTNLIELRLPSLHAAALIRRGRTRLDLGRPKEAEADLREVLDRHPTAPEAFQARLLFGRCHLDAGETAKAEAAWRELLGLGELTPAATEWRSALFSLAELLYRRGTAALAGAEGETSAGEAIAVGAFDEAIARLDEFLRRAPEAPQAVEARVLRADALRRRAELALRRSAVAETANLRDAGRHEAERLLNAAVSELRTSQEALAPLADRERLPRLGQELLKATYFDLGHAYAALGRDREAVVAYGAAVNRYPDDPRVIATYLRIAECQRNLRRPDEAQVAVEQARLLLGQVPERALAEGASALSRPEWETWIDRLRGDGAGSGQ